MRDHRRANKSKQNWSSVEDIRARRFTLKVGPEKRYTVQSKNIDVDLENRKLKMRT